VKSGENQLKEDRAQTERDMKAGNSAAVAQDKARAEQDRHDLKMAHEQEARNAKQARMEQNQINQEKQNIKQDKRQARIAKSGK
jgi:hypothetical protein